MNAARHTVESRAGSRRPAATVHLTGRTARALDMGRGRLARAGIMIALAFLAVAGRTLEIAVLRGAEEPALAAAAPAAAAVPGGRADIVDRNGVLLATSLPSASLYADPKLVLDPQRAARRLVAVLPRLDEATLARKLAEPRRFVWIDRGLTPEEVYRVNALGIPGLAFETEQRRIYPAGRLTAHVVGFTDVDGRGLAGVERSQEARLTGSAEPLRLTLDLRLQEIVTEELAAAIDEFSAIGGAAVVLEADTGAVRAMVSLPTFDPYDAGEESDDGRFNRATLGVYEMGSTFKVFNTAMALDTGTTSLREGYDATDPIRVGRFTIRDFHPEKRWLSTAEILLHSSNIGSVRMALDVGTETQRDYLSRFGMTRRSPIELPEVGAPMVPEPWREINTMTIAFGHGMAVSPMQLVSGVATAVNGGVLHPPTLLEDRGPAAGTRVIAPETSETMRRLLRLVVEEGTGKNADAEGYVVGGKTGTAEKSVPRGYDGDARLSSFVAAFPMTDPEFVVFAMLDEPEGTERTYGYATGGWTAAPVVRRVIERMGPMIGRMPVDETAPEIVEALHVDLPGRAESRLAAYTE